MKWSCGVAAVLFNGLYLSGSTLGIKLLLSRFYFTSVLSCHMERKTMIDPRGTVRCAASFR